MNSKTPFLEHYPDLMSLVLWLASGLCALRQSIISISELDTQTASEMY